jgi:hypothetical protein
VNLVWAALIVAAVAAVAVTAILLVRRQAPEGSYFKDGDRASGVFGVLATGFSVLLGFIVFLAFESYDQSRVGAEQEALVLAQQVETAQFFPPVAGRKLTGELLCYGRSVISLEWPRSEAGESAAEINPWAAEMFRTLQTVAPQTPAQQSAYEKWLDQTSDREAARSDRLHGAVGVIPAPLWVVLFFIAFVIFVYMLFFADSGEGRYTQAILMGSVTAVIAGMLLLIRFLDSPFHDDVGGVQPVAMERTLGIIDEQLRIADLDLTLPCDERGVETS